MSPTLRPPCELSWFGALCDDDYEFLGVPDPLLRSSFEHCRDIALTAEAGGFDNLLLPSGYALGIDTLAFAAAVAPILKRMRLLAAVRIGEMWVPQMARQLATLDRILNGRLTVNIISSDLPGETLAGPPPIPSHGRGDDRSADPSERRTGRLPGRVSSAEARSAPNPHRLRHLAPVLFRRALPRSAGCRRPGGRRLPHVAGSNGGGRGDRGRPHRPGRRPGAASCASATAPT